MNLPKITISAANAEITRLTGLLDQGTTALNTAKETHLAALKEKDVIILARDGKITELNGTITTLTGERDTLRTQLAERDTKIQTLEGKQTTVETRAAEIAATVGGGKPIEAEPAATTQAKTPEALMAEFRDLQGKDPVKAAAFWSEHKAKLLS